MKVVELEFNSIIEGIEYFDNIKIYNALTRASLDIYGKTLKERNLDIKISSLFPKDGKNYLIPRPMWIKDKKKEEEKEEDKKKKHLDKKKTKKIKYIPINKLRDYLKDPEEYLNKEIEQLEQKEEKEKKKREDIILPRVQIPRIRKKDIKTNYFVDYVSIVKNKYYFLIDGLEEKELEEFLELLSIVGLGAGRNLGRGTFKYEIKDGKEFEEYYKKEGNYEILLSKCFPENEKRTNEDIGMKELRQGFEINGKKYYGGYQIGELRGIVRGKHINNIFFFKEGGVLKKKPWVGEIIEIEGIKNYFVNLKKFSISFSVEGE